MSVKLNHTIVHSTDKATSAGFLAEILGLPPPAPFGHFLTVELDNEITLDFVQTNREIVPQHYAFLVSEANFDNIFGRIRELGLEFWADPQGRRPGEINTNDGGRGTYFRDPNGHYLEIITRPYGSGD